MQKILFVSHCILNTAAKVVMYDEKEIKAEEELRRKFVSKAIVKGIQFVQLPCPEFTLYGARRWGHVSDQFDNPFFRQHCKKQLQPVLMEVKEYISQPERFEVLGFIGIDGSPSCGVKYTCSGPWGGSMSNREDWLSVVGQCKRKQKPGILYQVLGELLEEENISLPIYALNAHEPELILSIPME